MGQWNNSAYRICVKSDDLALSQSGDMCLFFGSKHYLTLILRVCQHYPFFFIFMVLFILFFNFYFLFLFFSIFNKNGWFLLYHYFLFFLIHLN